MAKSAHSVVMAVSAALLVLASAVLVARSGDDPAVSVLGRQVVRTTTTSTTVVAETTTTIPAPAVVGSIVVVTTTTTAPSGVAPVTTAPRRATTTTAPPSRDPSGRSVERADTTSAFDYRPDGTGTMTTSGAAGPKDPFAFSALGDDVDHDGVAELRAEMANRTSRDIAFPDGLVLRFVITRDGKQWRTVELRFPDTQSLPPNGSLEVETATPLQQQYGHFEVTGETTVEYG
jgi:hypothetical protein